MTRAPRRIAFLDRDGTLVWDRPGFYLRRPGQLRLYSGTIRALRLLRGAGYALVVVTNQSGIGRGFLDIPMLRRIHRELHRILKRNGIRLAGIYYCPHAPGVTCRCRKPSPYLARRALRELRLPARGAVIFGDKRADIDLGRQLGVTTVHLRTGHGRDQREKHGKALRPTHRARNLLEGVRWLLRSAHTDYGRP
ncbi:MAG: HAD-IIIA family hydrolase [Elusimicrobia bacterium]|nr:HAD-IIIA family hydrolase [Elusimicrobiota bacterium]